MQQHIKNVDRYLTGINQNDYELEIRFGEFRGRNFRSNNEPKVFYRMLNYFLTHEDIYEYIPQEVSLLTEEMLGIQVGHKPDLVTERVFTDSFGQRIREAFVGSGPKFYSLKTKLQDIDNTSFYHRFSISKEQNLGERYVLPADIQQQAYREKKRWSFALNKNIATKSDRFKVLRNLRIDLTHVTGWFINYNGVRETFNNFEIEAEIVSKPIVYERDVSPGVDFLLQLFQNTRYPISSFEVSNVITRFNLLFEQDISDLERKKQTQQPNWRFNRQWRLFNPINKPVNLKLDHLENIANLAITDKADGERKLLFLTRDGIYVVYPPGDIIKFSPGMIPGMSDTILDGELIVSKNGDQVFLPFDVLFYRGVDKRGEQLLQRVKTLDSMQQIARNIQPKKFYTGSFYANVNTLLDAVREKPYGNDGLIINPIDGDYSAPVYKWKPIELLTIDFHVEQVAVNQYKLLVKAGSVLEMFRGTRFHPFSGVITTEEPLITGQIVEMGWRNNTFAPLRIRHDRDQPNNLSTSLSIWSDIMRPIEEATIRGTNLVMLRHFHNAIKKRMLEECRGNYLLDIGSGRGGDLHKWKSSNLKVFAVEPSLEHIQEFKERLLESGYTFDSATNQFAFEETQVQILNAAGQDTRKIVESYKKTFDVLPGCITIFNALTFFFESETSLDALIDTIDQLLPSGGAFMGMVMDGDAVRKMMGAKDTIEAESWKISKLSDFTVFPYGNKIYIDLIDTIVKNQEEFLVDFKEFTKKLAERYIYLDDSEMLTSDNLSPSQEKLYSLYRTFKFKKHVGVPPAVTEELIQETIVDKINHLYVSHDSEHLKDLREEERAPFQFSGKTWIRIGTESDCMLAAIARSAFETYQMRRNTTIAPLTQKELSIREKYVNLFMTKILEEIARSYKKGQVLQDFEKWEDAKQFLSCNKLQWLGVLDTIAAACQVNIVYIAYYDSIRPPKIVVTDLKSFTEYVVILSHDTQFESVAVSTDEPDTLQTLFSGNPLV